MRIIFTIAALSAVFFVGTNYTKAALMAPDDEVTTTTTSTVEIVTTTITTTSTEEGATTTPDVTTTTESISTTTPTTTEATSEVSGLWSKLSLSELVSDPESGNEWVEMYNSNPKPFDLTGGYICDNRETTSTCKSPSSTIPASGYGVVEWTGSYLNNTGGDSVRLLDPFRTLIDEVVYGANTETTPVKGQSYAKNNSGQWKVSTTITKGVANTVTEVVKPVTVYSGGGGGGTTQTKTTETESSAIAFVTSSYYRQIIINEVFPDPNGSDTEEEFVEIVNTTSSTISVTGWRIYDNGGYYTLSGELSPGQIKGYKRKETNLVLGNSGDEIKLVNSNRGLVDSVIYTKADTGRSYNHTITNWQWSDAVTFGLPNIVEQDDAVKIIWKIKYPSGAEPGEKVVIDAEDSADPRGGLLTYLWNFGDTATSTGGEVEHVFATPGVYTITVFATSTAGTVGQKEIQINIGVGLSVANPSISITEIFPNPDGADDNEYIEVANTGSSSVYMDNWVVKTSATDKFVIPEGTQIAPSTTLVFYRRATKLNLVNGNGKVEIYNDNQ